MKNALLISLTLIVLVAYPAQARDRQTEHTYKLSPGERSPPATLADMHWLEGHWTADAFGGIGEESWLKASGGSMLGMYRIVRDGKPLFFELMMVVEERGSLTFKLKHFNSDLTGWEEKDKFVEFPLVAVEPGSVGPRAVHFGGMSFHPAGDTLTVYLAIGQKDGKIVEEKFVYKRVGKPPGRDNEKR